MGIDYGDSSPSKPNLSQLSWADIYRNLLLAYQSFGVVYGDLSISPLYVFTSTFTGQLQNYRNEEAIFGAFSVIFWTLMLIPLLKYVIIVMNADDNGQGGPVALYSLLCRHGNFSLLPNHLSSDEDISSYKYGHPAHGRTSAALKTFLEKHKKLRVALLVFVLFGACMVIGDGVFTPAISVLSAVSGLQLIENKLSDGELLLLACGILVGIFALQYVGTHRVAVLFAPIVVIWLVTIFLIGLYNTLYWNPKIIRAVSPHYIIQFFQATGYNGWVSLGGIILSITGSEALFAGLGHFTAASIKIAFAFVVYPCLVVQYLGQAAFLSRNTESVSHTFYDSIPDPVFWPVLVIATLAAVVGSQAVITATFSIINQCQALGCFPRVKVVHTSKHVHVIGQIYIPEINWMLMILTLAITIGFQDIIEIGNAYGLACMMVMCSTTFLTALVMLFVWQKSTLLAIGFLLFFWSIEVSYLSASLTKVAQGGWVPLVLSCFLLAIMYVWHYGTRQKHKYDETNKVSLKWILGLGPSLGIVRVPGIGLIYSDLVTGIPAIFSHFVTNLPAFHDILVFVCLKSVPVPFVSPEERILVGRICPSPYRMYRCIARYGYKDVQGYDGDFEDQLIQSIAAFIQTEDADDPVNPPTSGSSSSSSSPFVGKMAVINSNTFDTCSSLVVSEVGDFCLGSINDVENPETEIIGSEVATRKRKVRFELPEEVKMEPMVKEELMDLIRARETGVAYIMGHSFVRASSSSSFIRKVVIDVGFTFLRVNSRRPAVVMNIPLANLIEVGMVCRV